MEQLLLLIVGGIAWAFYSLWEKRQEQEAEREYERRREAERGQAPAAPASPAPRALANTDRRYQDIQEEIRRKIAERQQQQQPPAAPPPRLPPIPPAAPRPYPTTVQRPDSPPPPVVVARRPPVPTIFTAAPIFVEQTEEEDEIVAQRHLEEMRARFGAVEAAGPILGGEDAASAHAAAGVARMAALRTALQTAGAARQAFLFREIFDRPISERPGACGGHEGWT